MKIFTACFFALLFGGMTFAANTFGLTQVSPVLVGMVAAVIGFCIPQ